MVNLESGVIEQKGSKNTIRKGSAGPQTWLYCDLNVGASFELLVVRYERSH